MTHDEFCKQCADDMVGGGKATPSHDDFWASAAARLRVDGPAAVALLRRLVEQGVNCNIPLKLAAVVCDAERFLAEQEAGR